MEGMMSIFNIHDKFISIVWTTVFTVPLNEPIKLTYSLYWKCMLATMPIIIIISKIMDKIINN